MAPPLTIARRTVIRWLAAAAGGVLAALASPGRGQGPAAAPVVSPSAEVTGATGAIAKLPSAMPRARTRPCGRSTAGGSSMPPRAGSIPLTTCSRGSPPAISSEPDAG